MLMTLKATRPQSNKTIKRKVVSDMDNETVEVVEQDGKSVETADQQQDGKFYSQEELDNIIKSNVDRAVAKAHKEAKAQQAEAEKLRQMNEAQKAEYEKEKQAAEIQRLTAELNRRDLEAEAMKQMSALGIGADESLLKLVVRDTADDTHAAIQDFHALVRRQAEEMAKAMLKGQTPKATHNVNTGITQEQFNRMGFSQRNELAQAQPELYAKLAEGEKHKW